MNPVKTTKIQKFGSVVGWVGIILIQSSTIPVCLSILNGTSERIPPLDMTLMIWAGLFLFLIRSIIMKDVIYIVSNAVGFFFQTTLLFLIVFK